MQQVETLFEMMRQSNRPLSVSLAQSGPGPGYRRNLDALERARAEGLQMRAQVAARAIGVLIGLEGTVNPLRGSAASSSQLRRVPASMPMQLSMAMP